MNYQDLLKAREFYETITELCDLVEEKGLWDKPDSFDLKLSDVLQCDVANFIMYLSASDGHLSAEEVEAYRVITGFGGDNANSIITHIKENNIYSTEYESEPPLIMKILSQAERKAVLFGAELDSSILQSLVAMFKIIGQIIISIDGGITYTEKRDLNIIISTIEGFANDHNITGNSFSIFS